MRPADPWSPRVSTRRQERDEPLVSAVIPVYNRASLVGSAIEAALGQRRLEGGLEVIVVDDGSTDDLQSVLCEWEDRIRVVRQPNRGPSAARNVGLHAARGRWVAFLDSDDLWVSDKLAQQCDHARRTGAPFVYTDRENFGADVEPALLSQSTELREGDVFEDLLVENFVTLSSVMARKDVLVESGGFDETLVGAEDWDLWLRVAARHHFAKCAAPLTKYRRHAEQISKERGRMAANQVHVVERALAHPRARDLDPAHVRRVLARSFLGAAGFARVHSRLSAIGYALRALYHEPRSVAAYREVASCCVPPQVAPLASRLLAVTRARGQAVVPSSGGRPSSSIVTSGPARASSHSTLRGTSVGVPVSSCASENSPSLKPSDTVNAGS